MADNSKVFSDMAARIAHNQDAIFGGAWVFVSPSGYVESDVIFSLRQDEALFWASISSKLKIIAEELEKRERVAAGFARR